MKNYNRHTRRYSVMQVIVGALFGIVVLHPLTTLIFWLEYNDLLASPSTSAWAFLMNRLQSSPLTELVPMNAVFALVGVLGVYLIGSYTRTLQTEQRRVQSLEAELSRHLPSLIPQGEGERLEFKSTLRWDRRERRCNKVLEKVVTKSIAGLMNHRGGTLLIGVNDDGEIVGIEDDCQTLKHKNSDGFERVLMDLVRHSLGPQASTMIHPNFPSLSNMEICQIVVEPSDTPVFLQDGKIARYYVRTGNSTREFDARETHIHVAQRNGHLAS